MMYQNLYLYGIGGFVDDTYWSSSEFDTHYAWIQDFYGNGSQIEDWSKNSSERVRAVRAF